ncbi:DUF421 domain-containing protein [Paenibacillus agricola]|uniref:DUF421 domain-containing protein n=1 Tax=Paenibacillus agricola TaxID=2716264 RepID=A0ABX0J0F9_9BACL|nr:DUF421 domain-containing protein [Paenibacillus agricola]NHN28945.1 DUF421 domain-containing protein [Paenibacillus agricola]
MPDELEIILRTLLSVVALFFLTKLLGKRQVSQLSLFEYITGITIGSLAAYVSLELDAMWHLGLISIVVWVAFSLGIEWLQLKSKTMRDFVDGKATILIKDGKVMDDNLKKERITTDELMEQLRAKQAFSVADVEFALIEPSGEINVLLTRENQPLTPKHLGIKVAPEQEPQAVIMDGKILNEPLATIGLSRQWLNTELEKLGIPVENVFLGQVDSYGKLYVDLFDDKLIVALPQERQLLFATLKKCQADLTLFGLTTENQKAKTMYEKTSNQMEQLIKDMKPILCR